MEKPLGYRHTLFFENGEAAETADMSEIDLRKVLEQGRAHEASLNIPERTYSVDYVSEEGTRETTEVKAHGTLDAIKNFKLVHPTVVDFYVQWKRSDK